MVENQKAVHFKGLNFLRAIACLAVVVGHIELSKSSLNLPNLMEYAYFSNTSGHLGVILFFVLSGFLISYLLLKEKKVTGTIQVKKFYVRRLLRIWPIYLLAVLFLFFVLPNIIDLPYFGKPSSYGEQSLWASFAMYVLMAPNFMVFGIAGIGGGYHLGTIGIEEQFYLFWPLLMKFFKRIQLLMILIFVGISLLPHFLDYVRVNFISIDSDWYTFFEQTKSFFEFFKINCMALGGLLSYWYFTNKTSILKFLFSPLVQFIALVLCFLCWFSGFSMTFFNDEYFAILFGIIIINAACNPKCFYPFDNKFMNKIGTISYGIYIYHWAIIYLVINLLLKFEITGWTFHVLLYALAIPLTLLIAFWSYNYFESYFIQLKKKFTIVKSSAV